MQVAKQPVPPIKQFLAEADTHWRRLFNVEKLETINRTFGNTMLTDGKAVAAYFEKPRPAHIERAFDEDDLNCNRYDYRGVNLDDYTSVWGLDPGQRDVFHAVDDSDSDRSDRVRVKGQHLSCTGKEYSHMAR